MKNYLLSFFLLGLITGCTPQIKKNIEYQKAFAKVYGYVKYFHPSDEAASIDWDNFAIYGSNEVDKCASEKELLETLKKLFEPIAPSIKFYMGQENTNYNLQRITPKDSVDHTLTYWQHKGVSLGMTNRGEPYSSVRVNREFEIDNSSPFGNIMTSINASKYVGKEFKYSGWVKLEKETEGTGHLWFRVDRSDGKMGFFDNMGNAPITENEWKKYEIVGTIDSTASNLVFGCFLNGKGKLFLDNIKFEYKEEEKWVSVALRNSSFESKNLTDENQWSHIGSGYAFGLSETDKYNGNKSAAIQYEGDIEKGLGTPLFDKYPEFGELINKKISENISCQIPIALYSTVEHTYPNSNQDDLVKLKEGIEKISNKPIDLSLRLGNVINVYNVFQHFYPYFDVVNVDWEMEFEEALSRSYNDRTGNDHLITLQKLTASLKDGHIRVWSDNMGTFVPPITWEWIENKLTVTIVYNDSIGLEVGDEVLEIDGKNAASFFEEINSRISAGTDGWLKYRAHSESLLGEKDSKIVIGTKDGVFELTRDKDYYQGGRESPIINSAFKEINNDVFYLNLDIVKMDKINNLLPELLNYKSIIFDLRGYPKGNHGLISHLLKTKDTTAGWMQVPQIIFPDQEKIIGWEKHSWTLETAQPYLGDKQIIFITDGRAISYAESFMGYIEGYELGTIIGQPTAGTNGNINPFKLPGGYSLNWTGMKVTKHDGSQHHGIGIIPDIYVTKTIEGIKAGRDEFLEKAIELTQD